MRDQRQAALEIFHEALDACSLGHAFTSKFKTVSPQIFRLQGKGEVDLTGVRRILIVAIGKGAAPMLDVLLAQPVVTEGRKITGILVAPRRPERLQSGITYFAGGHPSPNEESFEAARAVLEMLQSVVEADLVKTYCFFLVSGGASAMMELPLDPEITLDDTIQFHKALVHSGASIAEINCVRKHFSAVKGGRLAIAAGQMRSLTIAVSDVPAGQLDVLASGPTLPDTSTIADCEAVLAKYDLFSRFPDRVREFFRSKRLVESPKPGDFVPEVYPLLSSDDLALAAQASAERHGFTVAIDNSCDDWDYQAAADYLLERMRSLQSKHPVCLISAGEVTVRLPALVTESARNSVGGRNLQFALYSALQLRELERVTILSAGSDGIDGSSPAAGAVVDRSSVERREDAQKALNGFDAFPYLDELGLSIMTGPTGNNLRDLRLLLSS